ncbi:MULTISPECIES: dTDP-4-dehydrorhamnose 3,5-epimerase [Citrobacter]|uniref:dTDP-4-dehydrorhamnose 3,5-epimerase n=1 Tax=Citrobacter TaxID=544 RepID=UPI0006BA5F86|nr:MULTISPECIES: dTDP-4-dehydrorhamnose 3,5-epimerase [Citrobacter]ELB4226764.1 dTDP-4-dehydrorhamnose 3,5-epimerase [Citrobacter amalonaticus]MDM3525372.1 dTDP-4-dehydrorhamnose 3,5-epimerase [Citrobacter sp. Ca226]UYF54060.1 dTDP-4-dehydrorhamnose 3,5-epimerase [Citrobacter amalonaticus]HED1790014.1 dTDP-4-dehydrorhamnose 3,5-epimerase [Citrobacter amalonaticus]
MKVHETHIPGVLIFEPQKYGDSRGYFFESYNMKVFEKATGKKIDFVQDNQSFSRKNVIRGLHYQDEPYSQGKLVRCISGEIFDVAVDLRQNSATYGQWIGEYLSGENCKQLWIPEGFAHGFCVVSDEAIFTYKCTNFYNPAAENTIRWDSPELAIKWPVNGDEMIISDKDLAGKNFL